MKSAITANNSTLVDQKFWHFDQKYSKNEDTKSQNNKNVMDASVKHNSHEIIKHPYGTSSRQLNSTNSIDEEMTHFKPIRLMPMSGKQVIETILKIPTMRCATSIEKLCFYSPSKSKFKPEVKIKFRRSAFCLVQRKSQEIISKTRKQQFQPKTQTNLRTTKQVHNGNHLDLSISNLTNENNKKTRQKNYKLTNLVQELNDYENTIQQSTSINSPKPRRYFLRTRSKTLYFPQSTNFKPSRSTTDQSKRVTRTTIKNNKLNGKIKK